MLLYVLKVCWTFPLRITRLLWYFMGWSMLMQYHMLRKSWLRSHQWDLNLKPDSFFADVICSEIDPQKDQTSNEQCKPNDDLHVEDGCRHKIGGSVWDLPIGQRIEDCLLLWIGSDNSAFANVVLMFNNCEIDMMQKKISW